MEGLLSHEKDEIREIYESRNILKALVVKNLIGRYRNSVLGFGWHFIMPIVMMCVYHLVFSQIRVSPIDDFWVYLSSGLFAFNYMTSNLVSGSSVLVSNSGMIKKMYFPREILVLSQVISSFIIMMIGYALVLAITMLVGFNLTFNILLLPLVFISIFVFVTGYVLVFSALTVYVRDVQYFLSSISMVFFFLTPMYFTVDSIGGMLQTVVWLNPFTYYVETCHDILFYGCLPDSGILMMLVVLPLVSIFIGIVVFRKLRVGFAERL
ncbi:ABC transporter permease [Methanomethylophilus alvi]|uniref:ABC transporter permease n=1 Tax=Methanomethylophilus alvi TaxID=1291540 RepID=UPI0037DCD480